MREIRLYGSEGGGAAALPTPIVKRRDAAAKSAFRCPANLASRARVGARMGTKNFIACLMADLSFDHLLGKIPVHHFLLLVGKVDEVSYSGGPMTGQSVFYRLFAGA